MSPVEHGKESGSVGEGREEIPGGHGSSSPSVDEGGVERLSWVTGRKRP